MSLAASSRQDTRNVTVTATAGPLPLAGPLATWATGTTPRFQGHWRGESDSPGDVQAADFPKDAFERQLPS